MHRITSKIKKESEEKESKRLFELMRQMEIKKQAELHSYKMAVLVVQKYIRRFVSKCKYRKFQEGLRCLQNVFRLRLRRVARRRREAKLKREADEIAKQEQLLLQQQSAETENNTKDLNQNNFLNRFKSMFTDKPRKEKKKNSKTDILSNILHRRAVKIQSIFRMYRARRAYIAKRRALGLTTVPANMHPKSKHHSSSSHGNSKLKVKPPPEEEDLMPLNPLHMIKAIRKVLKNRKQAIQRKAIIKIQALTRGYLVRHELYRSLFHDDNDGLYPDMLNGQSENDNLDPAAAAAAYRRSPRKAKPSILAPLYPLVTASKRVIKKVKLASAVATNQIVIQSKQTTENALYIASSVHNITKKFMSESISSSDLIARRKRGIVAVQDALLKIECLKNQDIVDDFPRHFCYFKVTPFATAAATSQLKNKNSNIDTNTNTSKSNTNTNTNTNSRFDKSIPLHSETVRSVGFPAFNNDLLNTLEMYLHMSSIERYDHVEIVLYMALEKGRKLSELEIQSSKSTSTSSSSALGIFNPEKLKNDGHIGFIRVLKGTCAINNGNAFSPCGMMK